nr:ATP-binding protein [Roseospira visakhapatnamensis]
MAWAVPDTWGSTWTTDAEDDRATVQKTATGDAEADESATGEPGPGAGPAVMPPPLDSPSAKPAGSTLLETEYRWLVAILGLSTVVLLASGGLGVWFFSLNQQLSREADQRRSAEARYRMLIEAAPLPVLVLTMDGRRVLFANSRARGMLGNIVDLPAPPQTPRTDLALFASPEDGDALLRAVRKGTAVIDREMRLRRADGHALWVHMSADSISYEGDDAIFLAFADITARRAAEFRLRDSERRLRMLTENMVDVIWTLDESLHYTYISPSVRRLRGYTHDDIIGIAIDQVIQPDAYRRLEDFIRTSGESVRDTGTQAFMDTREEWELPCKGGGTVWTEVNIRIFFDEHGRFTGIQGMSRNISERRTLEEDLRRSNADLEQFAYAVSHDLQQPLRMVSQFLGLLKRRLGDDLEGEHREFLDFAVDGARHMHDMIKDLLEFSRVGRGEIQHDPLPLDRPLDQALHMLDATIREAGAIVERHPLPTVPGDEGQFTRLFQNLLDNALKYVAPDRRPHIVISAHAPREGWCEVSVADNGIGVDPRQVGRLFAVFQRLQPAGEYPGTGVGLAICRRIVERHGGRIRLESEGPHRGATVTFTLPAAPAADGRTDGPSPPAHPPTANG